LNYHGGRFISPGGLAKNAFLNCRKTDSMSFFFKNIDEFLFFLYIFMLYLFSF